MSGAQQVPVFGIILMVGPSLSHVLHLGKIYKHIGINEGVGFGSINKVQLTFKNMSRY